MDPLSQIVNEASYVIDKWGLSVQVAIRYAVAAWLTDALTGEYPEIYSGARSLASQRALYDDWREGRLRYRPARYSWHVAGQAFDLAGLSAHALSTFVSLWKWLGGRWGGDFSSPDPPHFDFPTGSQPPAAW